jgi:RNA polymerase sigma factor (sigma-70 family)
MNQEEFDKLLLWLDPDRDRAGKSYEHIRKSLINIFTLRKCNEAEDLTDEVINRVSEKVEDLMGRYVGNPALYFYGVAKLVFLEHSRRKALVRELPSQHGSHDPSTDDASDLMHMCLDECLETLTPVNRNLILRYYENDKQAKIEKHKALAAELGIASGALRQRALRIRIAIQECVLNCLDRKSRLGTD